MSLNCLFWNFVYLHGSFDIVIDHDLRCIVRNEQDTTGVYSLESQGLDIYANRTILGESKSQRHNRSVLYRV